MKNINITTVLSTSLVVLMAAGCAQQQQRTYKSEPATITKTNQVQAPASSNYGPSATTFMENGVRFVRGSMAFPTGLKESSGLLIEKTVPAEVLVGQPFSYNYKVSNLTDYPIHMVTLSDRVSPGFNAAEASPKPADTKEGVATWDIGTLGPKESKVVRVNGSSKEEGSISTCGWATYSPLLCEDIKVVKANLQLTKTAPAEVTVCDKIPMTLTVKNTGSSGLSAVKVQDTLPQGLTAEGKRELSFDAGNLAPGESKQFKFDATAAQAGKFVNNAKASSAQGVTAEASATTQVRQPILAITCKAPEQRYIGRPFEVCFTVSNKGDSAAEGAVVEVPVPAGLTFKSATAGGTLTAGKVTWNLGAVAANAPKDLCVTLVGETPGDFAFSASTRGSCAKVANTSCATRLIGVSALLLEKADNPDPISIGEATTYTVKVTNQGTADDTNIKMVVEFPAEISPVSASNGGAVEGKRVTFPPFPRLAPKQAFTYTIQAKGEKVGDARVRFIRTSDGIPAPTTAEESTRVY